MIKVNLANGRAMDIPEFEIPEMYCSQYVRLAAKKLFGKKFSKADAWDRRYKDILVCSVSCNDELAQLAEQGILEEGMIIGVFNPQSMHLMRKDMTGKPIAYSHNALYLGRAAGEELVFAEQFGRKTRVSILQDYTRRMLGIKEVLDSRG